MISVLYRNPCNFYGIQDTGVKSQNNRKHDSGSEYKFTINNSIAKQEQIYALFCILTPDSSILYFG